MQDNQKLQLDEIKIERINSSHNLDNFQSYEKELVDFLKEDAFDNQQKQISTTYLWFLKTGELIGYISLLNDRINLEGDLKEIFRKKNVAYHSLPALKIGRLCVDNRFLRRNVGTLMISFAIKTAQDIFNQYSGCRFVVLDAKSSKTFNPIYFYKKIGFNVLKERKKGTIPMYLDLVGNIKLGV